jgi:putative transposase
MARIARAVAPGIPHHIIQRGNRRQQTFFNDEDYQSYLKLMSEWCLKYQEHQEKRYLLACTRYVELNPVRAGLVKLPEEWSWSSAASHMKGKDDILV